MDITLEDIVVEGMDVEVNNDGSKTYIEVFDGLTYRWSIIIDYGFEVKSEVLTQDELQKFIRFISDVYGVCMYTNIRNIKGLTQSKKHGTISV